MREIGGDFWDVPSAKEKCRLFPENTQWFLSGRSALSSIIKELGTIKRVSLPSWCCESMIKPFVEAGKEIGFYPVYFERELKTDIEEHLDSDALLIMDYFGYTDHSIDLRDYNGILIRDLTHSLFSRTYSDSKYYFGSLRKWCGVWTGGYAWTNGEYPLRVEMNDAEQFISLRKKAMKQKKEYIFGSRTDKGYLKAFEEAEMVLDKIKNGNAHERDVQLAQTLDSELVRNRRRANAMILRKAFPDWLLFPKMSETDCPMFVPVLVPEGKRNKLREFLIEQDIYCPVHWPESKYLKLEERTSYIYMNEISLVCDQRYDEADMNRMVRTINLFLEGC